MDSRGFTYDSVVRLIAYSWFDVERSCVVEQRVYGVIRFALPIRIPASSLTGIGGDRPNIIGDPNLDNSRPRGERILKWFNTAAYAASPEGTFGNLGRNTGRGPASVNIDGSLFKAFSMPFEGHKLEFRGEFFNVINRVNLGNPNASLTNALFGRITSAGDPRIIQLGLRYAF